MPPRDIWDCNVINQNGWYYHYCEFLLENAHLDILPASLIEDSECWADETDTIIDSEESWEYESLDSSSDEEDVMVDDIWFLYDEINMAYSGTMDDPIDLSCLDE